MFLTALIAIVVLAGLWNLTLKIFYNLILTDTFDPTDYFVLQTVLG